MSFPSHLCQREIMLFRCGFWQLPLILTSRCPKSPQCSWESQATLTWLWGQKRMPTERILRKLTSFHCCWIAAHPCIVYCELILMPGLCSLKKITLYNCMSGSGKMNHCECHAERRGGGFCCLTLVISNWYLLFVVMHMRYVLICPRPKKVNLFFFKYSVPNSV